MHNSQLVYDGTEVSRHEGWNQVDTDAWKYQTTAVQLGKMPTPFFAGLKIC